MLKRLPLILMTLVLAAAEPAARLMPLPARLTAAQGRLPITENFRVALTGYSEPRLQATAQRLVSRLSRQTGIPILNGVSSDSTSATLVLDCARAGEAVQAIAEDESYRLEVGPAQARLNAVTPLGILRGIETFLQLVQPDPSGWAVSALRIEDQPRFPWRGLLIDVARHYISPEVLERNIDAMAALKLNVLHLHLSDNQGYRVESKVFPELHEKGSDGQYYTQDQLRALVSYARERGIRVLPEFDMPGHTTSFFVSHPELASGPGPYQLDRTWGVKDPCMDPTKEETYAFLDKFIGEMAGLFPDRYFHMGGDENNGKEWNANPRIQAYKRDHGMKTNHDLQVYFNQRLLKILAKYGKTVVGWDEILHPDLPKEIVVHSWRGQESLAKAARQGYQGILSFGYYLDLWQPASQHYYSVDPMDKGAELLSAEEKKRILGGEACMWSEFANSERLDSLIWPRNAAIAERLWSPQTTRDVQSMYERLEVVSRHLEWLGLTHRSSYEQMLHRLSGGLPTENLKVLADVVEPVKGYARNASRKYTMFTPMNRLVDAAKPESEMARQFSVAVNRFLAEKSAPAGSAEIRKQLAQWRDSHKKLSPQLETSFLLKEAIPLSVDLSKIGDAGLRALESLTSGKPADAAWVKEQLAFLNTARKPRAELLIMVVQPVRKLVEAAGQAAQK